MLSWPKIKKQLVVVCLIFLISFLGVFVLGAKDAQAGIVNGLKSIFGNILLAIQGMVGVVVVWLAGLGLGILNFANPQKAQLVQEGWKVARNLANMFFVLILLAIAFATILRIETYGMKSLLPKLIIAALLINFSLVFAGVIIDFSGVMTDFFVSDGQVFFKNIAGAMKLPKIMTTTAEEKGEQWQCHLVLKDPASERYSGRFATQSECNDNCPPSIGPFSVWSAWTGTCESMPTAAKIRTETDWKNLGDSYWAVISSLFFSIMFTVVAAFVFGALAFLLLGRILIIWFLLILAPIAWLFWVLPATRHLFSQWWNTFIKWVFFAPAAIFFIWLSVKSWSQFISISGGSATEGVKQIVTDEMLGSQLVPQIMEPANFVQFLLVCGMLLGSLVVAQKMGIYGAQGAIDIAKGVGKWAGKLTMRPPRALGEKIGAGAMKYGGKVIQKIPKLKAAQKLGRRMEARATMIKRAPEERPEHKKYAKLLDSMSAQDVLKEAQTARGIRGLMAAKKAQGLKQFRTTDNLEQVRAVMNKLKTFNATEELVKAEDIRPDAIVDPIAQKAVVQRITQEGNLNKLPPVALQDEQLVAAIAQFAKPAQIESLGGVSPQHKKELTDALEKITAAQVAAGTAHLPINKDVQQAYASQKGDISRMSTAQKIDWAKNAGPDGLKRMDALDPDIAVNIPVQQLIQVIQKMENPDVAIDIIHEIRTRPGPPPAARNLADKDPYLSNL